MALPTCDRRTWLIQPICRHVILHLYQNLGGLEPPSGEAYDHPMNPFNLNCSSGLGYSRPPRYALHLYLLCTLFIPYPYIVVKGLYRGKRYALHEEVKETPI